MAKRPFSSLTTLRRGVQHLTLAVLLATSAGAAVAQAEPSLKQIYDTAQSGKVAEAQVMVQQVLTLHPQSAKAHFVQAELFARQGNAPRAREALAQADKLAPGLPFASAASVSALREQLAVKTAATSPSAGARAGNTALGDSVKPAASAAAVSSFPLGLGLALGGAAIGAAIFFRRKKSTAPLMPSARPPGYTPPHANFNARAGIGAGMTGGLSGPQTFGNGNPTAPGVGSAGNSNPGYGNPGNGNPGYGQPVPQAGGAMSGMGGRLAGGLATGLAVGAGVMAAQAIGNSFSNRNEAGHTDKAADTSTGNPGTLAQDAGQPLVGNQDLGGQNFGFNASAGSSWDDAGSADFTADAGDAGGGGDWDT